MMRNEYYQPEDIDAIISRLPPIEIKKKRKRTKDGWVVTEYLNIAAGFDIETSSFYDRGEKRAIMYEWTFGIEDYIIIGRTWGEFVALLDRITDLLHLSTHRRLVCGVHNLAFEFQFFRKWLAWEKVFAVDDRKPVYAITSGGVEFRCTYILSGYSLGELGDRLENKLNKKIGDLDYGILRSPSTSLTESEIGYCISDVKIVIEYLRERIRHDGDITKMQLTKTGYVRKFCRDACLGKTKERPYAASYYRAFMRSLNLTADEYAMLKRAFAGGFTHASAWYSGKMLSDVRSYDLTSAYPFCMVAEAEYPISSAEIYVPKDEADFRECLRKYCCFFDITFYDLEEKIAADHPISASKCWCLVGEDVDNGRVVCARKVTTTISHIDFEVIERFYSWSRYEIGVFRRYRKGYLPRDFIMAILKLYGVKTELKGYPESEPDYACKMRDYNSAKEKLNAAYGMIVTDICRGECLYNDEWIPKKALSQNEMEEKIRLQNEKKTRFLFYPWGCIVTALCRRIILNTIAAVGSDHIYADTDSEKIINGYRHEEYFARQNDEIIRKIRLSALSNRIPEELFHPKNIKGVEKWIGVFENDANYDVFKTLGAKRYAYRIGNHFSLTVSGVNKKKAAPFLVEKYGDQVFDAFNDELFIPANHTGKLTHTYIDDEMVGEAVDYQGRPFRYYERSGVHLENASYSFSIAEEYARFLLKISERSYY